MLFRFCWWLKFGASVVGQTCDDARLDVVYVDGVGM
jgi:hypothetical protein